MLYDEIAAGTLLLGAFLNYGEGYHDALREMIAHADTVIGLSDGGAHVKMICDASMPTYLLTHWARDRRRGQTLPLELVIAEAGRRHGGGRRSRRPRHASRWARRPTSTSSISTG